MGSEAVSTGSTSSLHHFHLLPSRSFARHWLSTRHLRRHAGTGSRMVWLLRDRLRRHARACASTGERARAPNSRLGPSDDQANGFTGASGCEKRSILQARYYDFNVWSERKRMEKLRYMHRNPVKRGLVARPEDWAWSSFRHYLTGEDAGVEIESQWTARKRERLGIYPTVRRIS